MATSKKKKGPLYVHLRQHFDVIDPIGSLVGQVESKAQEGYVLHPQGFISVGEWHCALMCKPDVVFGPAPVMRVERAAPAAGEGADKSGS